jgi:hypothetical protein
VHGVSGGIGTWKLTGELVMPQKHAASPVLRLGLVGRQGEGHGFRPPFEVAM